MMPSLVICDGVHAPHGDILLKRTLASVATGALIGLLSSNSSANMCTVFLGTVEPATQ